MSARLAPESAGPAVAAEPLLRGAVDSHCHPGPSVMSRRVDHVGVLQAVEAHGMRAVVVKDHYHSTAPLAALVSAHLDARCSIIGGVALNHAVGGINLSAVEHSAFLGGRFVWMPTVDAANHRAQLGRVGFDDDVHTFSHRPPVAVFRDDGAVRDDVKAVLDAIARHDLVLASGHLHVDEVWRLFDEARARGVGRMVVNHPTFLVDVATEDMASFARADCFLEHVMYFFGCSEEGHPPESLKPFVDAGTVERTILATDLGIAGCPEPIEGMRHAARTASALGYSEAEVRRLVGGSAAELIGLEVQR